MTGPGPGEEPPLAGGRPTGWTLGMVVVAGAFVWSLALGPVVALMSSGQVSIWEGWFALPSGGLDDAAMEAALPGLLTMVGIGAVGLALAGLVRLVRDAISRRERREAARMAAPD